MAAERDVAAAFPMRGAVRDPLEPASFTGERRAWRLRHASANRPSSQEDPMLDCLMLLAEPLFSMVDLALDRPLAALVAVSAFAVLVGAALLAGH
jgi:hypothetical protein